MTPIQQAQPIIAAINDGLAFGLLHAGQECPTIPDVVRMVGIDDHLGRGPIVFDANALFDQVDSVILDCQLGEDSVSTPALLAAKARAGERTLLIQTTPDAGTEWLRFVGCRERLKENFVVFGIEKGKPN